MKTIELNRNSKRYSFRTTAKFPDKYYNPYSAIQEAEMKRKQNDSFIVDWQMDDDAEKEWK